MVGDPERAVTPDLVALAAALPAGAVLGPDEDLSAYGAPPPEQVIAHTNLYWTYHQAPGREAGTVSTIDWRSSVSEASPRA